MLLTLAISRRSSLSRLTVLPIVYFSGSLVLVDNCRQGSSSVFVQVVRMCGNGKVTFIESDLLLNSQIYGSDEFRGLARRGVCSPCT